MFLFAVLPACVIADVETAREDFVTDEPFTEVVLDLDSGDVTVVGDAEATVATGAIYTSWAGKPPEVTHYVEQGVLHVTARCEPLQFVCDVDLELTVPAGVSVTADTGSGDVSVADVTGDVDVASGSGDLDLAGLAGRVDAETGSGDVSICDVTGDLYVDTGSGDVQATGLESLQVITSTGSGSVVLEMVSAFEALDAESGSGDLLLTVPAGHYDLALDTGSGDVVVDPSVVDDLAANARVRGTTGSGDITVLGR